MYVFGVIPGYFDKLIPPFFMYIKIECMIVLFFISHLQLSFWHIPFDL